MADLTEPDEDVMSPLARPAELTVLTGGSGWFGRAYLASLAPGGEQAREGRVRVLVPSGTDVPDVLMAHPGAEVHVGDVADPRATARLLRGAEGASVVHAAGVIHPSAVAAFDRVNVGGTRAMVDSSAQVGVARFIHLSSNSPFGVNATTEDVFRQDEPYNPYLGYGQSKMRGELVVREAQGDGRLSTVIVRPPWFYGPWQPARQTTFFTLVRRGRFPLMGDGSNRRSMAYVGNLVQGVVLAETHPQAVGHAYWVADERPYPMAEVVETVKRVLVEEGYAVSRRQVRVPPIVGRAAERIDRFLQSRGTYNQEIHVLGEMDKTIACDISRTRTDLGYQPGVSLEEGMRRSIRWCRSQGIDL